MKVDDLPRFDPIPTNVKPGPHHWPPKPEDFGSCYDYQLVPRGRHTAIVALSEAALQFCYRFLPAWVDRYGDKGFLVESDYVPAITELMAKELLISITEYTAANENDALARQWENNEE